MITVNRVSSQFMEFHDTEETTLCHAVRVPNRGWCIGWNNDKNLIVEGFEKEEAITVGSSIATMLHLIQRGLMTNQMMMAELQELV